MKITSIKQQVKNPERASIFVDGKYSFSLSLNDLLDEKLKLDLELDEARLKLLKIRSEEGKLKLRAHEWLLRRPHSIKEFNDYMRLKKAAPELAESLKLTFSNIGLLNDAEFSRWFIEQRIAFKQRSQRALRVELRAKGVDSNVIDEALALNASDESEILDTLIAKKRRLTRYKDDQKLMKYLISMGFPYEKIKEALKTVD